MKTIIKFPIYVEIHTQDGMDRRVISRAVLGILKNEVFENLRNGNASRYFSDYKLRELSKQLGPDSGFRFISDVEIAKQSVFVKSGQNLPDSLKDLLK